MKENTVAHSDNHIVQRDVALANEMQQLYCPGTENKATTAQGYDCNIVADAEIANEIVNKLNKITKTETFNDNNIDDIKEISDETDSDLDNTADFIDRQGDSDW